MPASVRICAHLVHVVRTRSRGCRARRSRGCAARSAPREHAGLLGQPVVGEVAAERRARRRCSATCAKSGVQRALRGLGAVDVADGGDADGRHGVMRGARAGLRARSIRVAQGRSASSPFNNRSAQSPVANEELPRRRPKRRERRERPRRPRRNDLASPTSQAVYRRVMESLSEARRRLPRGRRVRVHALHRHRAVHQGLRRLRPEDRDPPRARRAATPAGFRTELTFPHWLGKAYRGQGFRGPDLQLGQRRRAGGRRAGSTHAHDGEVLGVPVKLAPAEEMLWSKAFVMERERYDGADVIHILRARAEKLDWDRVLARFGDRVAGAADATSCSSGSCTRASARACRAG